MVDEQDTIQVINLMLDDTSQQSLVPDLPGLAFNIAKGDLDTLGSPDGREKIREREATFFEKFKLPENLLNDRVNQIDPLVWQGLLRITNYYNPPGNPDLGSSQPHPTVIRQYPPKFIQKISSCPGGGFRFV